MTTLEEDAGRGAWGLKNSESAYYVIEKRINELWDSKIMGQGRTQRKMLEVMRKLCASTASGSGPKLPGVAAPLVDLNSTIQVGVLVTRSRAARARAPVDVVDLEDANIV